MEIIIDGYNLLKQILPHIMVSSRERNHFIARLNVYAKHKGHNIICVFDGGDRERPTSDRIGKVTVVYSGYQLSADAYIKEYVAKRKAYDILLVSSDRELCVWAARYDIPSLDVHHFNTALLQGTNLNRQNAPEQQLVKVSEVQSQELDALMEEAAKQMVIKSEESDYRHKNRSSPSYTPSKKERALLKKIKKL